VVAPFSRVSADHNHRGTTRTRSKLECCVSFSDTESADAPASREPRGAGMQLEAAAGTSHHGRDERGGSLAVTASFGRVRTDHDHRDTTRTRSKLECCVSSPETASTDAPAPQEPLGAGLKFEAAGSTSHHGRAPKERALSPVRRHSTRHERITASTAPRAREASSSAASPPQRQRAPTHLRRASHAALA